MLNSYLSTGYYIDYCDGGSSVPPETGVGVYISYLDQADANCNAYSLAIQNAAYLRSLNPCNFSGTTTTTTTTSTTTLPPGVIPTSGIQYSWTGYFSGENGYYYDIVAWGNTNGYLSGNNQFQVGPYFTNISANDINGNGTVLAVLSNGTVTGFGDNSFGLLNIPSNLNDALQVSVGYDHVLVLRSTSGQVTGWGDDQWNALSFNSGLSGVIKVCAGVGTSFFLLNSGNQITGINRVNGSYVIKIPQTSNIRNFDHYYSDINFVSNSGYISGFGTNSFGVDNIEYLNGISNISAGKGRVSVIYNNEDFITFGLPNYNYFPAFFGGVDIQIRNNIGTSLQFNKSIYQWNATNNFIGQPNAVYQTPNYIYNNVTAISQAQNFTAAIIRRPCFYIPPIITGNEYLWEITNLYGNFNTYGGLSVGDLFPSSGLVSQPCNCSSFYLPIINNQTGQQFITGISTCDNEFSYNISFISIKSQPPFLNINYTSGNNSLSKTGYAATGISTGDYWNNITLDLHSCSGLVLSNGQSSNISGGYIQLGTGSYLTLGVSDHMYNGAIQGLSGEMIISFSGIQKGFYDLLTYGHGKNAADCTLFSLYKNGFLQSQQYTTTSGIFNTGVFINNIQYVTFNTSLDGDDLLTLVVSGFINGLQLIETA